MSRLLNYSRSWVPIILLAVAIIVCALLCAADISTQAVLNAHSVALIQALLLLVAAFAVSCPMVLGTTILDRLDRLKVRALQRAEGESVDPLTGADFISDLDRIYGVVAAQRDEALLREQAIADYATDFVCSLDEQLNFAVIGPTSLAVWGYDSAMLLGKGLLDYVVESDRERTRQAFTEIKAGSILEFEIRMISHIGSLIDMHWSVEWSQSEQCYFCIAQNITERKALERMKERFFAMVSHDVKAPMSSMQISLAMLSRGAYGELNQRGQEVISSLHEDVDRIVMLITDLLEFESLGSGEFQVKLEVSRVNSIVIEAIRSLKVSADAKQISVQNLVEQNALVMADPGRLLQVLINVLSNAIKHSPDGAPIELKSVRSGEWLEIQVIDCGSGVPLEHHGSIFEPYSQVDRTRDRKQGGIGLGLAISKQIVESHGGAIGVRSNTPTGSIFWFRIRNAPQSQPEINSSENDVS